MLHTHALQALLLVVRNCYHVYLMSRSDVNQTTAKAALTQVSSASVLRCIWTGGSSLCTGWLQPA